MRPHDTPAPPHHVHHVILSAHPFRRHSPHPPAPRLAGRKTPHRPLLWALCDLLWQPPAAFHAAILSPQTVYDAKPPPYPATAPPAAALPKKNTLCFGLKDTVLETETQCLLDPETVSPDFYAQKSGASSQNPRFPPPFCCSFPIITFLLRHRSFGHRRPHATLCLRPFFLHLPPCLSALCGFRYRRRPLDPPLQKEYHQDS